ncbi:MAG: copper homeostasis periplasmic binding protein CopC [Caulobacteraceae bacterium]|nr:copper homeostasis periplasmic binding protein CopC [Caulobacteraceae bacterium]
MRRFAIAALATVAIASAAVAHPRPQAASPAPDAVLSTSPSEIRITFSEGLVAAFSAIELKDAAGKAFALGPSTVDLKNKRQLVAPVTNLLPAGTYTVSWRAVGDDTHHVSGHYSFQVKP